MLFNSFEFLVFLPIVFLLYWFVFRGRRWQNLLIVVASYVFYGYTDWRMVPLLASVTVVFYFLGALLRTEMDKGHKKNASRLTTLSVVLGIGLLFYFKYLNFFAQSLGDLLKSIGFQVSWSTLHIIMPIGVSFFTFKLVSYIIEIHREHIMPSDNGIEFATYVAFFPTILSGPIDRPGQFLPQLRQARSLDYPLAVDGCRQILWGLFTKLCIADNIATITEQAWSTHHSASSTLLLLAAILYPIQLYADFDGYSNMAIGIGKLMGFHITRNFNHPFLARNMAEFWRRWHISLTSWITDYVFMPLNIAFRERGNWGIAFAALINLIIIGFWHGANWTYGVFGLYHGLLFFPLIFSGTFAKRKKLRANDYGLPKGKDFLNMVMTYILICIGLVIFRAESMGQVVDYLTAMVTNKFFDSTILQWKLQLCFSLLLLCLEWIQRDKQHALQLTNQKFFRYRFVRWSVYYIILLIIFIYAGSGQTYIYFQF